MCTGVGVLLYAVKGFLTCPVRSAHQFLLFPFTKLNYKGKKDRDTQTRRINPSLLSLPPTLINRLTLAHTKTPQMTVKIRGKMMNLRSAGTRVRALFGTERRPPGERPPSGEGGKLPRLQLLPMPFACCSFSSLRCYTSCFYFLFFCVFLFDIFCCCFLKIIFVIILFIFIVFIHLKITFFLFSFFFFSFALSFFDRIAFPVSFLICLCTEGNVLTSLSHFIPEVRIAKRPLASSKLHTFAVAMHRLFLYM